LQAHNVPEDIKLLDMSHVKQYVLELHVKQPVITLLHNIQLFISKYAF
jgi:hypothetical protein